MVYFIYLYITDNYIIIIIIIGIQPLGRFGHRPELSQSTGIALVRCILGKFLGGSLPLLSPNYIILN